MVQRTAARTCSEDEFREMLREFLAGNTEIDPAKLVGAAGLPNDPAMVANLIAQLRERPRRTAATRSTGTSRSSRPRASPAAAPSSSLPAERSRLEQALHVRLLWLDEATTVPGLHRRARSS